MGDCLYSLRYMFAVRERIGKYVRVIFYCRKDTLELARPLADHCYIELEPYHDGDGKGYEIDVRNNDVVLASSSTVRLPFVRCPEKAHS